GQGRRSRARAWPGSDVPPGSHLPIQYTGGFMGRRRFIQAGLAVAMVCVLAQQSPAAAALAPGTPVVADPMAQEVLSEAIQAYVHGHQFGGYAGSMQSLDGKSVTVYWAGGMPAALTGFLTGAHGHTAVTVVPVRYSETAMAALARSVLTEAKAAGIPVAGAGPTADFSGLRVAVTAQATDAQRAQLYKLGANEIEVSGL